MQTSSMMQNWVCRDTELGKQEGTPQMELTDSRKTHINNVRKTRGCYQGIGYKGERWQSKNPCNNNENIFITPLTHGMECDIFS